MDNKPLHIGIIMDGNGRWAKQRFLPRSAGHKQGAKTLSNIARYCKKIGVKYLTIYAFSTENWNRPADEVEAIMNLLREYLSQAEKYKNENVCSRFIGDRTPLAPDIVSEMERLERESSHNDGFNLTIAINYGGRDEIIRAVKEISKDLLNGKITPEDITEQMISSYVFSPDPDLIIRPSGEKRLSNFLLWQSAYTEFVYMDVLWPDFNEKHLDKAIEEFSKRNRRFGGI